jgi:hypothetical protein
VREADLFGWDAGGVGGADQGVDGLVDREQRPPPRARPSGSRLRSTGMPASMSVLWWPITVSAQHGAGAGKSSRSVTRPNSSEDCSGPGAGGGTRRRRSHTDLANARPLRNTRPSPYRWLRADLCLLMCDEARRLRHAHRTRLLGGRSTSTVDPLPPSNRVPLPPRLVGEPRGRSRVSKSIECLPSGCRSDSSAGARPRLTSGARGRLGIPRMIKDPRVERRVIRVDAPRVRWDASDPRSISSRSLRCPHSRPSSPCPPSATRRRPIRSVCSSPT